MEKSIRSNRAGSTEEVIRQRRQRTILRKLRGSDLRKAAFLAVFLVLLFRFNTPASYVDYRPITGSTAATREYLIFFDLLFALVLASVVLFAVAVLVADYVAVLESNGEKKTIFKRIITFFREYKSEISKITWPGMSTVSKNTIVVLVMCVIVGILIFLLDTGLVWILDSILKLKS